MRPPTALKSLSWLLILLPLGCGQPELEADEAPRAMQGVIVKANSAVNKSLRLWRPVDGYWHEWDLSTGAQTAVQFGASGDVPVRMDRTGDGVPDHVVWRARDGNWHVRGAGATQFGGRGDYPVPADYDGDHIDDFAVFRRGPGTWHILPSAGGSVRELQYGQAEDVPVPGDYDGDGYDDVAIFRPTTGEWHVLSSAAGSSSSSVWGKRGDLVVPGDYDGDGRIDRAIFRPWEATWHINQSSGGPVVYQWGMRDDVPIPLDYDGDGRTDLAVYRPSNGNWYMLPTRHWEWTQFAYGEGGDIPVTNRVAERAPVADLALVARWAPIHYQDVDKGACNGICDYVVAYDYDYTQNPWDKWDHIGDQNADLAAHVYTKVVESSSHWFIYYMFYHPRDWTSSVSNQDSQHENDAEGLLAFVRKDGSPFGKLEGMLTQAHGAMVPFSADLGQVVPKNGWNGAIQWEYDPAISAHRPRTYQESAGHGFYACGWEREDLVGHPEVGTRCDNSEDGVRYTPNGWAETPGTVGVWSTVSYGFRDLDDLWLRRNHGIFTDTGEFWGNRSGGCGTYFTCTINAANPIWKWLPEMKTDPALLVRNAFQFVGVELPTSDYLRNDFTE